eukprot:TRINITY_DN6529_c0_g1_i1.p1 TRINITY_DN6529_c0_g1~~TRINITY_DN6529_c0_g1_i1.p1  ORF type:complete len:810 (-),score=199.52 TRINITY_DN6529_c0_g1_i1:180-2360(-)
MRQRSVTLGRQSAPPKIERRCNSGMDLALPRSPSGSTSPLPGCVSDGDLSGPARRRGRARQREITAETTPAGGANSAANGVTVGVPQESEATARADGDPMSTSRTGFFVIFDLLDTRCTGVVAVSQLIGKLKSSGIHNKIIKRIVKKCDPLGTGEITFDMFCAGMTGSPYWDVLKRMVEDDLIIPDWPKFILDVKAIVKDVEKVKSGQVANYIPQLACVNPDLFAIAIQTVDGQTWSYGYERGFSVQSVFLPVAYLLAQQQLGEEKLAEYIGHEPSGRGFQSFELKDGKKPHNAMVSAGAILLMSLLYPSMGPAERFQSISSSWEDISGHCGRIEFDNSVYLSELGSADRNFALAHYMKNEGCFPPYVKTKTHLDEHMRFYFQNCSISCNILQLVGVASTLANGGVQPLTRQQLYSPTHVKNCLSLMFTCGMYDNSGTYGYTVGFPSKGSVSGAMVMVIPGVLGIAIYSPRVDTTGSPVIGMQFAERLSAKYSFHVFDMVSNTEKEDPTNRNKKAAKDSSTEGANVLDYAMLYGAIKGDVNFMRSLIQGGVAVNVKDLDGRTPLHLASANGNLSSVSMLLDCGASWEATDRFGKTPVDEAVEANNKPVLSLLKDKGARVTTREARLRAMMHVGHTQRRAPPLEVAGLKSPRRAPANRGLSTSAIPAAAPPALANGGRKFASAQRVTRSSSSTSTPSLSLSLSAATAPQGHDKKYQQDKKYRTLEPG